MDCCNKKNVKKKREGFLAGLIYGLVPHIGCIAFVVFAVLGATAVTALFKPLLLNPYFFYILIALSFVFATISAFFYLKKQGLCRCEKTKNGSGFTFLLNGIKTKWKYLLTLYGTTIAINLILFMVMFPVLATIDAENELSLTAIINAFFGGNEIDVENSLPSVNLQVEIPCPGHAPLITGELKTIQGVESVRYRFPNRFIVNYNPQETSRKEILNLDIFRIYKATVINKLEN